MSAIALLALLPISLAASLPPQNYVNTAVARTVELGGSITQVTTQFNIKALEDGPGEYHLALAGEQDSVPAWWEILVGGKLVSDLEAVSRG